MAQPLQVVAGNTAPQFQITCKRPDSTIIDLTNCTVALYLYSKKVQTNTGHETSSVTVLNTTGGIIGWQPGVGDLGTTTGASYKANIKVTYSDLTVEVLYNQALFKARDLVQ